MEKERAEAFSIRNSFLIQSLQTIDIPGVKPKRLTSIIFERAMVLVDRLECRSQIGGIRSHHSGGNFCNLPSLP